MVYRSESEYNNLSNMFSQNNAQNVPDNLGDFNNDFQSNPGTMDINRQFNPGLEEPMPPFDDMDYSNGNIDFGMQPDVSKNNPYMAIKDLANKNNAGMPIHTDYVSPKNLNVELTDSQRKIDFPEKDNIIIDAEDEDLRNTQVDNMDEGFMPHDNSFMQRDLPPVQNNEESEVKSKNPFILLFRRFKKMSDPNTPMLEKVLNYSIVGLTLLFLCIIVSIAIKIKLNKEDAVTLADNNESSIIFQQLDSDKKNSSDKTKIHVNNSELNNDSGDATDDSEHQTLEIIGTKEPVSSVKPDATASAAPTKSATTEKTDDKKATASNDAKVTEAPAEDKSSNTKHSETAAPVVTKEPEKTKAPEKTPEPTVTPTETPTNKHLSYVVDMVDSSVERNWWSRYYYYKFTVTIVNDGNVDINGWKAQITDVDSSANIRASSDSYDKDTKTASSTRTIKPGEAVSFTVELASYSIYDTLKIKVTYE
ncbi:MAG: hypothetical protein K6G26_05750 [Lachnospiraceae bacterium]|nr:hypothetical protein [Lachnospiraceae bacterium]